MRFGFAPKLKLASPALYHPLPLRSLNFWQQGCDSCNSLAFGFGGSCVVVKLVNGSRVGQVGPVDSCGQVGDRDLVSKFTQPLAGWTGQTRKLVWTGQKYPGQNDKLSCRCRRELATCATRPSSLPSFFVLPSLWNWKGALINRPAHIFLALFEGGGRGAHTIQPATAFLELDRVIQYELDIK